jgi:hypothetical protein
MAANPQVQFQFLKTFITKQEKQISDTIRDALY